MSSHVRQAREALGSRLREIRQDANLSGRRLAALTGFHFTKVSKIEHGTQNPSEQDIRTWCQACGEEDQIPELIATVRNIEAMYREWRKLLSAGLKHLQESAEPLYERTKVFRIYSADVIPGIFQTAEYAAAVFRISTAFYELQGDIDAAIAARLARQRFLYEGDHRFACVLEAQTINTVIGSPEVMAGQLDRLLAVMSLPRVSLGVIPRLVVRRLWPGESFWAFGDETVLVEGTSAQIAITQPREIRVYGKAFTWLKGQAVFGQQARDLISAAIRELTQHDANS